MVVPLSEVPQEGSSDLSLFFLKKLNLVSHPLASSYSRVTVSSVFRAQNIFFRPKCLGPVNKVAAVVSNTVVYFAGYYCNRLT